MGVANQQASTAHPPGLPVPATNQQQLQDHVRQLLQEVSSSDHVSSSDNDEHETVTPTLRQILNLQNDKQGPASKQQAASPKGEDVIMFGIL